MKNLFALLIITIFTASPILASPMDGYSPIRNNMLDGNPFAYNLYDNAVSQTENADKIKKNSRFNQKNTKKYSSDKALFDNEGNRTGTFRKMSDGNAYIFDNQGNSTSSFYTIQDDSSGTVFDKEGQKRGSWLKRSN